MSRTYPGLTGRMASLMAMIESYVEANGHGPSFDEMKEAMHLRSKSGIHRLVTSLEERGYISRMHQRARCIEILRPSSPPVMRCTVDVDADGRFVRLITHEMRPVVMVYNGESMRPATSAEVVAA